MSDTPETDAFSVKFKSVCGSKVWVPADICRRFERERNEARDKYDKLATEHMLAVNKLCEERDDAQSEIQRLRFDAQREAEHHDRMVGELEKVYTERDDALEKIKELIYIADRAIDLADIDFENDKFGVVSELRSDLEKIKKQNYHSDKMSSFVSESSK